MKVIVECPDCGNKVEVIPETYGKVAHFEQRLIEHDFSIFTPQFEIELQQDVVTDDNDVDVKLKEICIRCNHCGERICLQF